MRLFLGSLISMFNLHRACLRNQECREKRRAESLKKREQGVCSCGNPVAGPKTGRCCVCILKDFSRRHLGSVDCWQRLEKKFNEQKGCCYYSGLPLELGVTASLDHTVSKFKGGTSELANLRWVHRAINAFKHTHSEEEFLAELQEIISTLVVNNYWRFQKLA